MCTLPAGLIDSRTEIFAVAPFKVKCINEGTVKSIHDLPAETLCMLKREMYADKKALKGLKMLAITEEIEMLEAYNHCKRGAFDKVADISGHILTSEAYECGMKGKCKAEGFLCKPVEVNGEKLTQRESQCLRLIGQGLTYKDIQKELCYSTVVSVNSLIQRLYEKIGVSDKAKVALIAAQVFNL
jgi:DNA-binding CsgD family transcriptional regulator